MRVLGIETATWTASIGVIDGQSVLAERSLRVTGSHAQTLLPLIDDTLGAAGTALAELGLIAVSIGPGSFTGLRIGLSVAKGVALATGVALIGVPTLEAMALAAGPRTGLVCPLLDARKHEVYGACFRWQSGALVEISAALVAAPACFAARITPPCLLFGDGAEVYADLWREQLGDAVELASAGQIPPSGAVVARLGRERFERSGADDAGALEPLYVRKSEAELHHGHGTLVERGKIDRGEVVG